MLRMLGYTYGNIIDQSKVLHKQWENKARRKAYESVISLDSLIEAYNYGSQSLYELANYFEVTPQFILDTIEHYKKKFGIDTYHNSYVIKFEPLQIFKHYDI